MSDLRGGREEPTTSRKRGTSASTSPESESTADAAKVKQDAYTPGKYDGYGGSLVPTNMNEIKYDSFGGEPMMSIGNTSYIPSLSDLNDNSELQELSFFNLQGVCQAEKEILLKIIQNSQWYSDSLFCFMRRSPSPSGAEIERCLNEAGGGLEGVPEVSGDSDTLPVNIPDDGAHLQNGPIMDIPQPHLPPVDEGNVAGVLSPVPQANIRTFYPNQPQLAVSSGPGAMPATSAQIPVSGGMMMYPQQISHMMQPSHSAYAMQVGYPPVHYGFPQQGGPPHVTYVNPNTGEPISPESVHMTGPPTGHQKGHHDAHHGIPHTSTTPSGYTKSRNHRRDTGKQQQQQQQQQPQQQQQQQQQQPFYYPSYGYAPGMAPYNHQQLAQNVTGSPIIMQAPGNIYPYHQPHHPSMYPQQSTSSEIDHHQSNVGIPPQAMSQIPGEIPPYAQQQHHHAPPMYHHSPTHSASSRGGGYPQQQPTQRQSSSAVPIEPPSDTTIDPSEGVHGEKSGDTDISQSATVARNSSRVDSTETAAARINLDIQKKSLVTESNVCTPGDGVSGVVEPQGPTVVNNLESLSEPSRDTEVVDRFKPTASSEKNVSQFKGASGAGTFLVDSQIKGTCLAENQEQIIDNFIVTHSVNGELKDIKPGKSIPRDKSSADAGVVDTSKKIVSSVESRQPGTLTKSTEPKVKSPVSSSSNTNNSVRSVSAVSNTTSSVEKMEEGGSGSGEFPQLPANVSNITLSNSASSSNSAGGSNTAAAKGRSWASIASAKSQLATQDGAKVISGSSVHGADVGSGDGLSISNNRLGVLEQYSSTYVPSGQSDKGSFKQQFDSETDPSVAISDENDPVALALGDFLRNYVLDHHSIALTPRGLSNQGNYCYINATLQSLLACPPFVNMFRAMGEILGRRSCRATPIIQNVYELVKEFEPLLRGNANKKDRMKDIFFVGANLEPIGIRKCLGLLEGNTFKVEGRQEDAEEFLSHLLNGLHDEMLKVMKWAEQRKNKISGKPATMQGSPGQGATNGDGVEFSGEEDDDQWQVMGAKNKSCVTRKTTICKTPISEAFLGQMCYFYKEGSTVTHKSATLQPFFTLQLDIQNDHIRSVKDALEAISAREEVSGVMSNGTEVEAWRQLSLEELPVVLILHLKRFVYEKNGNKIRKIDKKLDFGIDLEIGKEMLSPTAKNRFHQRQRQYKLFGVVYHDGEEAHKGHYISDCFHASGGSLWGQCGWLRYDDTSVKQIPESQMLNPQPPRVPYLLYYRRSDTLLSHVTQQQHKKDRP